MRPKAGARNGPSVFGVVLMFFCQLTAASQLDAASCDVLGFAETLMCSDCGRLSKTVQDEGMSTTVFFRFLLGSTFLSHHCSTNERMHELLH